MKKKNYTKKEKEENKLILNIEVKPANEFQKEVIERVLADIKRVCLEAYYFNKNNEVNIGHNLKIKNKYE